jgi:O-antigen ligase
MGLASIFIAYYVAHDPVNRMKVIRLGWIIGGVLAATCGMLDYLQIGGLFPDSIIKGRATGTFKDPNVFSTYLIFPGLLLMQGLMLGTAKRKILSVIGLLIITAGVFFSFSRGAWGNFVLASLLMVLLTFVVNAQSAMRQRILLFFIGAIAAATVAFMLLMTIEPVRDLFFERFSLLQRYDSGETGRFGNQLRSIPELMTLPLGYGPQQFFNHFGLDPHNTFINAFSSYGWLGGISFILLFITSIIVGIKSVLTNSPWQNYAIVVFCPMFTTLIQGVQIDMDHWRHLYWLIGMNWGLYAATLQPACVVGGTSDRFYFKTVGKQ